MNWITGLLSKHSRNIHLILVVALSLVLVLVQGPKSISSRVSQAIQGSLYYPFLKIKSSFRNASVRAADLDRLREMLAESREKLFMCLEIQRENERLQGALGFKPPAGYRLTPANVVYITGLGAQLPISAVINRGVDDSILIDMPVMNQDGLIGRVAFVMGNSATIQLLTDPSNQVAARLVSSRQMGIVKYLAHGGMVLDNFPSQADVKVGDTVISSGLGGVYPAGLPVGTVTKVSYPENEPFCRIELKPAADIRSLEEIFILKPEQ